MAKIYAPRGYSIDAATFNSDQPVGKTTVKLKLRKGSDKIPFPKVVILKGIGFRGTDASKDAKGEYVSYKKFYKK